MENFMVLNIRDITEIYWDPEKRALEVELADKVQFTRANSSLELVTPDGEKIFVELQESGFGIHREQRNETDQDEKRGLGKLEGGIAEEISGTEKSDCSPPNAKKLKLDCD
ncbi:Hypothetical predicted protein [Cloeon dipterum]|uniref:Uncharacterized protein n=1 Tax=Cloeon dipterum TaxID=197152 RepID=A0A8S1C311_9INSE|nr:Hypothetical predicted protein [Cloeon dipterum]